MAYQTGHKPYAFGGARDGAGRKPADWLKTYCAEIVEQKKLVDFLGTVASGKDYEMKDRIKCTEILLERGFGKPIQPTMPVDDAGKYQPYSITVKIDDGRKSKS